MVRHAAELASCACIRVRLQRALCTWHQQASRSLSCYPARTHCSMLASAQRGLGCLTWQVSSTAKTGCTWVRKNAVIASGPNVKKVIGSPRPL